MLSRNRRRTSLAAVDVVALLHKAAAAVVAAGALSCWVQHDVELEIESQDRGGTFLGTLWVKGRNHAIALVEQGYASLGNYFQP